MSKFKSDPLNMKKQFSDDERLKSEDGKKIILKPIKTYVSSMNLDITDLFSNNVISERVRHDPRDDEQIIYETIQELDSDDSMMNAIDEEHDDQMCKYSSIKEIMGSGAISKPSSESLDLVKEPESVAKAKKKFKRGVTQPNQSYNNIDDETEEFEESMQVRIIIFRPLGG